MKILVLLGLIGFVGIVLDQYNRREAAESTILRLQRGNVDLKDSSAGIIAQGQNLYKENISLRNQLASAQTAKIAAETRASQLERQGLRLMDELDADREANAQLAVNVAQKYPLASDEAAAAKRKKMMDDLEAQTASRLSRRLRIEKLQTLVSNSDPNEQLLFDSLHYQLESGEPVDQSMLERAHQSRYMQELLDMYSGQSTVPRLPESPLARFYRLCGEASPDERSLGERMLQQIRDGATVSQLLADPAIALEVEKSPVLGAAVDVARERQSDGLIVVPK